MIGTRHIDRDRKLTITGDYAGEGPDDPPGYFFRFDDQPAITFWISAAAAAVRFRKIDDRPDKYQPGDVFILNPGER